MSRNKFARNQLEKHGWTEGSGLGKNETGIKDAIKVKLKHDSAGVGHNKGDEFTFQWWDHVFNKAASSISVKDSEEGVAVEKTTESGPISNKKKKTYANKSMLYGQFVKGATLSNGAEDHIKEGVDSSDDDEEKLKMNRLMDDEMLERCGGMTAHKAARHGLKLSAKMARIVEQEKLELERLKRKKDCQSNSERRRTRSQTSNDGIVMENNELEPIKKKKKKKKNKEKEDVDIEVKDEIGRDKSKKKKGKVRKEDQNDSDNQNESEHACSKLEKKTKRDNMSSKVEDENDDCNESKRKKKRKRKDKSNETYLVEEYYNAVEEKCETVVESESRTCDYTESESKSETKKSKKKKKKMKVTEENVDGLWMFLKN